MAKASSVAALLCRRTAAAAPALFCRRLALSPMPVRVPLLRAASALAVPSSRFASKPRLCPEENLKIVIDSEIQTMESMSNDAPLESVLPDDFPFEVIDNQGDQTIILRREIGIETIEATVCMISDDETFDDEDEDDSDGADQPLSPSFQIFVEIRKKEGPYLAFSCTLTEETFEIKNFAIKVNDDLEARNAYQGPNFSVLDKTLQDALKRYLKARGIRRSLYDFLLEYMMAKDDKEYVAWLKSMKEFIEL